jgi:hypothetical protein
MHLAAICAYYRSIAILPNLNLLAGIGGRRKILHHHCPILSFALGINPGELRVQSGCNRRMVSAGQSMKQCRVGLNHGTSRVGYQWLGAREQRHKQERADGLPGRISHMNVRNDKGTAHNRQAFHQ